MRREALEREPFPFIVWWICNIDLSALFSGVGTGEFVGVMLKTGILPPPTCHLYPLGPDAASAIFIEEQNSLPGLLRLNHDVFMLAVKLGLEAAEWRQEDLIDTYHHGGHPAFNQRDVAVRTEAVTAIRESLNHVWTSSGITALEHQMHLLPHRSQEIMQQVTRPSQHLRPNPTDL
jgi:hypothetical protein